MAEERKLVTILFADIVGSTAMGAANDAEIVRRTLGATFDRARDILTAHGGTVEKFIGDAVMAVFGVPTAHDDDADRAVRAAFALRDAVAELNRGASIALEVRIGIDSGEAVAGSGEGAQFLVTGNVVNAAARLQSAASPGEILVGTLTRRLTRGSVRYGETRPIDAKGIGPIEASPAATLTSAVPEQQRGIEGLRAPLIGRDDEMRILVEAHRSVTSEGRAHLATIFGTPGSGKTRLMTEFQAAIGRSRVRTGRCLPYGQGITFLPVQTILSADAGIERSDARDGAAAKLRTAVLSAFGEASEESEAVARRLAVLAGLATAEAALPDVQAEDVADELRWGFRRFLERRAAKEPLTLVFEDIHWAEPGLLDLIEHVVEWSRAPLFVLCLARPELLESRPTWGGGRRNATAIELEPLTPDETRRLVAELLAIDALTDELRAQVVQRADGNPLYVEEFLRMLIETGKIEHRNDRWVASADVGSLVLPETLQGLIAARLDRATPELKRLLQRAAVMGRLFFTNGLAALAAGEPPSGDALREGVRRDLIVESDERGAGRGRPYRFKHVLIHQVVYESVPKEERSRLHDRYVRWVEDTLGHERDDLIDVLAYHAEQAFLLGREVKAAGTDELGRRAFDRLLAAGTKARKRGDVRAAANLYERSATVGEAIGVTPAQHAETTGFAALMRFAERSTSETDAALERALEEARGAGAGASEVLSRLLVNRAFKNGERTEVARRLFGEAITIAKEVGDPELIAQSTAFSSFAPLGAGQMLEAEAIGREALDLARAHGVKFAIPIALSVLAEAALQRGDLSRSIALREEAYAVAQASGSMLQRHRMAMQLGNLARWRRDYPAAQRSYEESLALATDTGSRLNVDFVQYATALAHLDSGEYAKVVAIGDERIPGLDPATQRLTVARFEWLMARALVALGDVAAARRHADRAIASSESSVPLHRAEFDLALAELRAAERDAADAERLFRGALDIFGRTELGLTIADTRLRFARFLIAQRRYAEARPLLEQVRAFWSDPIAFRWRELIDDLLRQCEVIPAR
ncbi:MAG TPA: adenylate/guanylate cyclase domain-containing protein [Candidatus Limnocylindria bacterium]|jgi:class 3 adenylate cyclase/tetratricopeptide (TPR) repeat protein